MAVSKGADGRERVLHRKGGKHRKPQPDQAAKQNLHAFRIENRQQRSLRQKEQEQPVQLCAVSAEALPQKMRNIEQRAARSRGDMHGPLQRQRPHENAQQRQMRVPARDGHRAEKGRSKGRKPVVKAYPRKRNRAQEVDQREPERPAAGRAFRFVFPLFRIRLHVTPCSSIQKSGCRKFPARGCDSAASCHKTRPFSPFSSEKASLSSAVGRYCGAKCANSVPRLQGQQGV